MAECQCVAVGGFIHERCDACCVSHDEPPPDTGRHVVAMCLEAAERMVDYAFRNAAVFGVGEDTLGRLETIAAELELLLADVRRG